VEKEKPVGEHGLLVPQLVRQSLVASRSRFYKQEKCTPGCVILSALATTMEYNKMQNLDVLTAKGASGLEYTFQVHAWGTPFNAVAAVYIVLRKDGTLKQALYIGQTSDLSQRFENHHKSVCFDRNGKTHIAVLPEPSEQRRLAMEADLINGYRTPCND